MSSPGYSPLPLLGIGDFGPNQDHVAEAYHNGKVFAILHKNDLARPILPNLTFAPTDPFTYVFVHGGTRETRFENMEIGTHEIPAPVVALLLVNHYGNQLSGMRIRMCTCYGNMLRPGHPQTIVQELAGLVAQAQWEGYHGVVRLLASPARIQLGLSVLWDPTAIPPGPIVIGPPGNWEPIIS